MASNWDDLLQQLRHANEQVGDLLLDVLAKVEEALDQVAGLLTEASAEPSTSAPPEDSAPERVSFEGDIGSDVPPPGNQPPVSFQGMLDTLFGRPEPDNKLGLDDLLEMVAEFIGIEPPPSGFADAVDRVPDSEPVVPDDVARPDEADVLTSMFGGDPRYALSMEDLLAPLDQVSAVVLVVPPPAKKKTGKKQP